MDAMRCTKRQALTDETATPIDHCTEDIKRQCLNLGHLLLSHSLSLYGLGRPHCSMPCIICGRWRHIHICRCPHPAILSLERGYYGSSKTDNVSPTER